MTSAVTLNAAHLSHNTGKHENCACQERWDRTALWKATVASGRAKVLVNEAVNGEYRHMAVSCSPVAAAAEPGQFFQLLCPQSDAEKPFFRRPMSLYGADPINNTVSFLYKVTGAGTRGLATLSPGNALDIMGPLGTGFTLRPEWRHIVVVGRGAGLATLAPLARAAKNNGTGVTAILSARNPEMLVSVSLFTASGAEVIPVVDSNGSSDPANVERILCERIAAGRCDALFTCGSTRLMLLLRRLAENFSLPGQVALEQQMACGIGLCYCCVRDFSVNGRVESRRVCADGPVFDLMEVMP